jgi:hypothetical protein
LELGFGMTTRIQSWSYWCVIGLAVWLGPSLALPLGGAFGLARGVGPHVSGGRYDDFAPKLSMLQRRHRTLRAEAYCGMLAMILSAFAFM